VRFEAFAHKSVRELTYSRLHSTKVDVAKRKYELLTPAPGKLPTRFAVVGNVEWIEVDD
jgi:hypothetical protein